MIFNSIRWRLQAWHGLILITVLTGFGLTAYHVARDNQLRRIDQDLEQRFGALMRPQLPSRHPDWPAGQSGPGGGLRGSGARGSGGSGGPGGPASDEPHGPGRLDSLEFLRSIQDSIQRVANLDADQTNAFYYVLWKEDGTVGASSANAPNDMSMPEHSRPALAIESHGREAPGEPSHFRAP